MQRRSFLKTSSIVATVGLAGIAGCSSPDGDGGDGTSPDGIVGTTTEGGAGAGTDTTAAGETTTGAGTEEETTEAETTEEGTADGTTEEGTETGTEGAGGGTSTVEMVTEDGTYYFDPIGLFVEPGTTITWTNESGAHSSTAYSEDNGAEARIPEDAESWDSGTMSEQGATFEHTFETTGTYDYYCTPHKSLGMVARIVVGEPGGPAEGSMPPDGDVPESQTIVDEGSVSYSDFSG